MEIKRTIIGTGVLFGLVVLSCTYKYFKNRQLYLDNSQDVMYAFINE